jgi:hypothetical protein
MKITKTDNAHRLTHLEDAFVSNFAFMPVIPLSEEGTPRGSLDVDLLLAGLIGVEEQSRFALGFSFENGTFVPQDITADDEELTAYLHNALHNFPGAKTVEYSEHNLNGKCYLVTVGWEWSTSHRIRDALGAVYQTKSPNFLPKELGSENFYSTDLSERSLNLYLERRRRINPNAIELRYGVSALPSLIGIQNEPSVASAAAAAFGRNGGVSSALYVQAGLGQHLSRVTLSALVHGDARDRHKKIHALPSAVENHSAGQSKDQTWQRAQSAVAEHGYSLGSDIFDVSQALQNVICQPRDLFRGSAGNSSDFDSAKLASVLREFVVNAYIHGHWKVVGVGRDDDDHNEATRLAIVHAENRIETINAVRPAGYLPVNIGFETASRRSALHEAFRDINYARGRSLGLRLVRHRLAALGLPSAIVFRHNDVFRAILPLEPIASHWVFPIQNNAVSVDEIGQLFALKLALLLHELDAEMLAMCLYIRYSEATKILDGLVVSGALSRQLSSGTGHWNGFSKHLLPTYVITAREQALRVVDRISARTKTVVAPGYLSIGALHQLSVRSTAHLTMADLKGYLRSVYAGEAISDNDSDRLATEHLEILLQNDILRYPNS